MNTEGLIRALALDAQRPLVPLRRIVGAALGLGAAVSCALFIAILRLRPDLEWALTSPAFGLKVAATVVLLATAASLLVAVGRPIPRVRSLRLLSLAPLLLLVGVVVEFVEIPSELWQARLIGRNAPHCIALIPLLSLAPAACLMWALRRAAPASPGLAGAIVGLAAGGIGASLYALSCPDDSPLFVATWYSLAVLVVAGTCAAIGRRCLRW